MVESESSIEQVGLDMRQIYHQALPPDLKNQNLDRSDDNSSHDFFFDMVVSVQDVEFKAHKVLKN